MSRTAHLVALAALGLSLTACADAPAASGAATPVYSKTTGRLEQLIADRDVDGTPDATADMDGAVLKKITLDRNHDGKADRWEYYGQAADAAGPGAAAPQIVRAEEANGPTDAVTRRERYERGIISDVDEDTDLDGRVDKWEHYDQGRLLRVDLDLDGRGTATRRLTYAADGSVSSAPIDSRPSPPDPERRP